MKHSSNSQTTVALLDGDHGYARLLAAVLQHDSGICRVSVYSSIAQVLADSPRFAPDVLLTDIALADNSAATFIEQLRSCSPQTAIIVLSARHEPRDVSSVFQAGASGYLLKGSSLAEIADAVKDAKAGWCPLSSLIARTLAELFHDCLPDGCPVQRLSTREQQILSRAAHGQHNWEIARALHLSEATVRVHLQNAYKKLRVHSRAQAAACLPVLPV